MDKFRFELVLPFVEDIYDLETEQLEELLQKLLSELAKGPQNASLPKGVDSFEKFERKVAKLRDCIELELEERAQVDNVISFFTESSVQNNGALLDDDKFFNIYKGGSSSTTFENSKTSKTKTDQPSSQFENRASQKSFLQDEIDPQHILDDVDSQYSQVTGNGQSLQKAQNSQNLTGDDTKSNDNQSVFGTMAQKGKMSKKDLAAFMKAKLSQTKISSQVTTQVSATGPSQKNFSKPPTVNNKPPQPQPTQSIPKKPPSQFAKARQSSSSDEDDWAKANSMINKPLRKEYQEVTQSNQVQPKRKKEITEEHKVINTSKNIYKPLFNLPAKEQYQKPQAPTKKEGPPALKKTTQQSNSEQSDTQKRNSSTNRVSASSAIRNSSKQKQKIIKQNGPERKTGSQFSKPILSKTQSNLSNTARQTSTNIDSDSNQLNEEKEKSQLTESAQNVLQSSEFDEEIQSHYHDEDKNVVDVNDSDQTQQLILSKNEDFEEQTQLNQEQNQMEVTQINETVDFQNRQADNQVQDQVESEQEDEEDLNNDDNEQANQKRNESDNEEQTHPNQQANYEDSPSEKFYSFDQDSQQSTSVLQVLDNNQIDQEKEFESINEALLNVETVQLKVQQNQVQQNDTETKNTVVTQEKTSKPEKIETMFERVQRLKSERLEKTQEQRDEDHQRLLKEIEDSIKQARQVQQQDLQKSESKNNIATKQDQDDNKIQKEPNQQLKFETVADSTKKQAIIPTDNTKNQVKQSEIAPPAAQQQQAIEVVKKKQKIPKPVTVDDESLDYTHLYSSFYDIFVGHQTDQKSFDPNYTLREMRNVYASFVNLMEGAHAVLMQQKVKFEANPLEKAYRDHQTNYLSVPDHFTMIGKNINEMENKIISRDQDLMLQAKSQMHLREKFKALKSKDENQILKEALDNKKITSLIDFDRKPTLFFRVIKNKTEVYDIITRSFARKPRWNELPHGLDLRNTWNLLWSWSKIKSDLQKLLVFQRANHFMGAKNVSRKDFLKQNIERAKKFSNKANKEFNIMPLTFILPKEYVDFLTIFSDLEDKEGKMNYWIMKPAAMSRGRGISLVNEISQVTYGEPMVMQRYLKNPLLLNGYKFDLRIYVLVTSVNPLEAFIYKEGFGRFSTQPYTLDPNDKANKFIHLTNVSINKSNLKNYDVEAKDRAFGGTKVSLGTLKKTFVEDLKIDWDVQIWSQIKQTCQKALVAAQNDIQFNPCCFDLYGFDIIFDEDLRCWLLEINSSPSLACDTLLDDMIKQRLIDDTIDLVNPLDYDRKRLVEVLERRIQEDSQISGQQVKPQGLKRQMNRDLTYILNGQMPRGYGEMPKMMGNFEIIAPTPQSEEYMKIIGGQKMFGSISKISERVKLDGVKGIGSLPKTQDKIDKEQVQNNQTSNNVTGSTAAKQTLPRRSQAQPSQAK